MLKIVIDKGLNPQEHIDNELLTKHKSVNICAYMNENYENKYEISKSF